MGDLSSFVQGFVYGKIIGNRIGLSYSRCPQEKISDMVGHLRAYEEPDRISIDTSDYLDDFFTNANHADMLCLKSSAFITSSKIDLFCSKILRRIMEKSDTDSFIDILREIVNLKLFENNTDDLLLQILDFYRDYPYDWEGCLYKIEDDETGMAGYVLYSLLYGSCQFTKTIALAAKTGFCTEELCTRTGTIIGAWTGIKGINKSRWIEGYNDVVCLGNEKNGIVISQEIIKILSFIDPVYSSFDSLNKRFYLESSVCACKTSEKITYSDGCITVHGENITIDKPAVIEFPISYPNGRSFCSKDCVINARISLKTDSEILQSYLSVKLNDGTEVNSLNKNLIKGRYTILELSLRSDQAVMAKTLSICVTANSSVPESFVCDITGYEVTESKDYQKLFFDAYTESYENCNLTPLTPNGVEISPDDFEINFNYKVISIDEPEYTLETVLVPVGDLSGVFFKLCGKESNQAGMYIGFRKDGKVYWSTDGINMKNSTVVQYGNRVALKLVSSKKENDNGYSLKIIINNQTCFSLKMAKPLSPLDISLHARGPVILCGYTFYLPSCNMKFPEINSVVSYIDIEETSVTEIVGDPEPPVIFPDPDPEPPIIFPDLDPVPILDPEISFLDPEPIPVPYPVSEPEIKFSPIPQDIDTNSPESVDEFGIIDIGEVPDIGVMIIESDDDDSNVSEPENIMGISDHDDEETNPFKGLI